MDGKKSILLFADWFEPGYKAGGPIRSCVNFVHQMKSHYTIYIFTTDRDLNDKTAYKNIETDKWINYEDGVKIFYCSPGQLSWNHIYREIQAARPDFIYLNSMFSRYFTTYPLIMSRLGIINSKIVLAPRGMLKSSALQFKSLKKKTYLTVFRQMGLHRLIHFHATDKTEESDVQKHFGNKVPLSVASNFPAAINDFPGSILKKEKELSVVFIGRLHPVKNLDFLLQMLKEVDGNISLTIIGNAEDPAYVQRCKNIINTYPSNCKVHFMGEIPNSKLPDIISQHHIFALPTQGENFGHAIFEALAGGKPVLISDQTPWRNLEQENAGWDIPLSKAEQFVKALQQAVDFDQQEYDKWSHGAWQFVRRFIERSDLQKAYNNLFS